MNKVKKVFIIGIGLLTIFTGGCNSTNSNPAVEKKVEIAQVSQKKESIQLSPSTLGYMTKTGKFHYSAKCRYYKANKLVSWESASKVDAAPCKFCVKLEAKKDIQ
jgi:Tfp pilus assembly protein PilX